MTPRLREGHGLCNHTLSMTLPQSPPSPASPTGPRSFINLNPAVRGQTAPFPATPTTAHSSGPLEPPSGVQYIDFIRTWSDSHVARWLTDIKCGSHATSFRMNDIRGDILLELDQQTLKEMGVSSIGDRVRIVNAVKALRQRAASRLPERPRQDYVAEVRSPPSYGRNTPDKNTRNASDPVQNARLTSRSTRPAPLQLNSNLNRSDLPRIDLDSANRATANHNSRPLPLPNTLTAQSNTHSVAMLGSSHSVLTSRANLPPLPPQPATKPPLPPGRPLNRPSHPTNISGRKTPTQSESPGYISQALPQAHQARDLLTPSSLNNWTVYGLPADPRPGNAGSSKSIPPRSTSPLLPGRPRPFGNSNISHVRNTSAGQSSQGGHITANKLPARPSTGTGHPYANSQLAPQQTQTQTLNLSPISESFITQHSPSGTPSPPSATYTTGRSAFNSPSLSHSSLAVPLETLRRKLVKFVLLPDEGLSSTITIDVATCAGGVEILEKVLKKFGKGGPRGADEVADHIQLEEGGLSIDGWGVHLGDGPGISSSFVPLSPPLKVPNRCTLD